MTSGKNLWLTLWSIAGLTFLSGGVPGPIQGQTSRRAAPVESWRKHPPRPAPPRPFALPGARRIDLENGFTALLIEERRAPLVTINVQVPAGVFADPPHQVGLAEATAELLKEGAGSRSGKEIARDVESLGGRLAVSASEDSVEAAVSIVAENTGPILDILGDILLRPTFPEAEVSRYKSSRIEKLTLQRQEPQFVVDEQFHRVVYGRHPYGATAPTPQSIASIDRAAILSFFKSSYTPKGSIIVVAGAFDPVEVEAKTRAIFGAWKSTQRSAPDLPEMPEGRERRVYLIDRPGSEQVDFRVGSLAVSHSDPDFFALVTANAVLGAGAGSRLFLNIREPKGYAYDVSSSVSAPRLRGTFFASAETRPEVAVPAIKEILAELDRLRTEQVSYRELQDAKNFLVGNFSIQLSTQRGLAEELATGYMLGLSSDYLERYRARIAAVTPNDIEQAALKHLDGSKAAIVVVGDAERLKGPLAAFGPVEVFDINGKPKEER